MENSSKSVLANDKFYHVTIKDYTDSECIDRRMKVRETHLKELNTLIEKKTIVFAGALIGKGSKNTNIMVGSAIVVRAENEKIAREILENDQFAKHNVWDMSTFEISEIKPVLN
ncbi:hypothetical protein AYI70_g9264 [Smittium culicis]|uniref:YCII-related domain-containing protein n=1 Tax=Smittium culicis TaxID=133412 RepID=A0A1R1XC64_9FUNG|nr:hypothetical protein AYI70_g12448 [Smittium culicis]OMJ12196.1 hypothetical protein AYI70_g9264 [Smittium culicis]